MGRRGGEPCAPPTTLPRVDIAERDASGGTTALLTEAAAVLELRTAAMERTTHVLATVEGPQNSFGHTTARGLPSLRWPPPTAAPWT